MADLAALLNEAKKQWWQSHLVQALGFAFAALSVFLIISIVVNLLEYFDDVISIEMPSLWLFLVSFSSYLLYARFSKRWSKLSHTNVLAHLNRRLVALEESAELVVAPASSHTAMQALQVERIQKQLLEQNISLDANSIRFFDINGALKKCLYSFVVALILVSLFSISEQELFSQPVENTIASNKAASDSQDIQWRITITPPEYTQLAAQRLSFTNTTAQLNIEAPEGSLIEWQASTQSSASLRLNISQQAPQSFVELSPKRYSASFVLKAPTLYSISNLDIDEKQTPQFYSLSMLRDQPPNIEIQAPLATVTEFKRSEKPVLDSQVIISDDYGLSEVYISASIAKGSGEAVKFRDEVFTFDSNENLIAANDEIEETDLPQSTVKVLRRYVKRWRFEDLGMEPGDELYFSVNAIDNRPDSPQLSVSQTKILKWLDDEDVGITSDGILMDFIPEYFKSQRQIIIETTELIERKPLLTIEKFEETSKNLAIAQSDLKLRYGQYLGDEFESGLMQTMEAGPTMAAHFDEHEHDHEDDEQSNSTSADTHDHAHEQGGINPSGISSGFDEIIEKFGHNHGEADSGAGPKSGQLNPRALMKLSIKNMWQAELYLHLSDPKSALPYEQEALDYLNRARKAQRVYVKRLGFKPPPVSEERRYEGKLEDIIEPNVQQSFETRESSSIIKSHFLAYLSRASVYSEQMNENALALNQQVIALLNTELTQSENTNERLAVLAILETMNIEKKWPLRTCENCLSQIRSLLWQDLQAPVAQPQVPKQRAEQYILEHYQRAIKP